MLHLPRWATDYLKRADRSLAASTRPLALWEKERGAMRIVELDQAASALGLFIGQSVSDARAMVPTLDVREIDRAAILQGFADFADWHSNASPIVSILEHGSMWGDLVLDITGVAHLFGGEAAMLASLTGRLEAWGYRSREAFPRRSGPHGPWPSLRGPHRCCGRGARGTGAASGGRAQARAGADRRPQAIGAQAVGQLLERDRQSLKARFGVSLLLRLDQACGDIEEQMTPRLPMAEHYAERRFAEPIGLMDDVLMTAHDLAITLSLKLEAEGMGAQSFHLFLYRVDHKVMSLSVNSARVTRDPDHIGRLFSNRSERLGGEYDAGFGIDMIRLAVSSISRPRCRADRGLRGR